jgi:hypothetical protein
MKIAIGRVVGVTLGTYEDDRSKEMKPFARLHIGGVGAPSSFKVAADQIPMVRTLKFGDPVKAMISDKTFEGKTTEQVISCQLSTLKEVEEMEKMVAGGASSSVL